MELTTQWAGPFAGKVLAYLGAQCIFIESPMRSETTRGPLKPPPGIGTYPGGEPGEHPWNRSGGFNERHRGKLGLSLDLRTAEGIAVFKQLVALSDVVLVNFRATMLDNLGLSYQTLREINPQIILALMPGYGSRGPYKEFVSLGQSLEAISGAMDLTGYPDSLPLFSGVFWPDPVSGIAAVLAIVAALRARRLTGEGSLVELAQMELVVKMLGVPILDYTINGRVQTRTGNRHPSMAPHGVYPCAGEDQWIAITAKNDEQWRRLAEDLGLVDLVHDPRFSSTAGRLEHQDELDRLIGERTRVEEKHVLASRLETAGVVTSPVRTHRELLDDPHLASRGFFEEVDHPEAGRFRYQGVAGFTLAGAPGNQLRAAPMFGQHNDYALRELLGLPREEFEELLAKRVISDRPYKAAPTAL